MVEELFYDTPSYTGFIFPLAKYFSSWLQEETHPLVQAGQKSFRICGARATAGELGFFHTWHLLGWPRRALPSDWVWSGRRNRQRTPISKMFHWRMLSVQPSFMPIYLKIERNIVGKNDLLVLRIYSESIYNGLGIVLKFFINRNHLAINHKIQLR